MILRQRSVSGSKVLPNVNPGQAEKILMRSMFVHSRHGVSKFSSDDDELYQDKDEEAVE
jgi:hypothetical protein